MGELPTISTNDGIRQNAGERVRLVGRYTPLDVRRRRTPPPVYRGHVTVRLDDGTAVLLEPSWRPEAIRPPDELARYKDRPVVVVGTILPRAPQSPDGTASLLMPCLTDIESITEAAAG